MREQLFGKYKTRRYSDDNVYARALFSELIKSRRQFLNLSLQYVADALEVTRQAVWTWEHLVYPSDLNLDELCIVLGLDYHELHALKETT